MNASKCSWKSEDITGGVFRIAAFLTYFILECNIYIYRKLFTFRWYKNSKQEGSTASWGRDGRVQFERFLVKSLS